MKNEKQREQVEKVLKISEERNYYAVKSNKIIQRQVYSIREARNDSLSLAEQKALLYIISKIKPEEEELKEQQFSIKEFYSICGIEATTGNNYRNLKETITKLASRVMWLTEGKTMTTVRWIDKAKIDTGNGIITIRLDPDLKPYLLMLSRNYTKIPLHDIIKMKSKYGIMLYELLRSYAYTGERIPFSIEDLKNRLDCLSYENFSNFKKKVIVPALKDINTYSELSVDVEYYKTGRQYTDIVFLVRDLSKSKLVADVEESIRRFSNVEKEIDPNQITMFEVMYGNGEADE